MKIIQEGQIIKVFLNDIPKIDFKNMDELETYFRNLFLKLKKIFHITFTGLYNIDIYLDQYCGVVIELKKEYLEYIDYYDNEIDMRIISHDATFLYEIPDIFMVKNIPYKTIYYYHNKIYIEPKKEINSIEHSILNEMGEICYKTDDILCSGKKILYST